MNFLSICQRLRQEAGLSGSGPVTVLNQMGEMKRVVDWVASAYEDIQNLHATWRFLRNDFSFSTIANTQEYTPIAVSLTDFSTWVKNDVRLYAAITDEDFLEYYPWGTFREAYLFGNHRVVTGRPTVISVKPNNAMTFWAIPDAVYTVTGEYYKSAQIMTGDTSIPVIPTRFQMIIVWKALMHYGAYAGADEKYAHGSNEYKKTLTGLEMQELEDVTFGEPLA
jgi:hypothetical protein